VIEGRLPVREEDYELLKRYVAARTGLPVRTHGGFGRFLYFSTVTITTLGYGDIVPATDRARLAVGIESIIGIVLAGLFINAVGLRSARVNGR